MGNFNYIDFVTTQKHKLNDEFITNLVLEHLVKDYLNNNNIILEGQLDEGIKDFVQKIKTKIKGSKLTKFGELLKLLKQSRKPQAVISFLTVLRNLKLNLLDPEVVLAAFSIIAGTTNLNEVTKSIPKEKYDDTAKKLEPSLAALKKYFEEKAFGAILKIFLLAAPIFAMNADDIGKTLDAMGGNYKGQTVNPNQVNPEGFQSPNTIALDDAIDMIDDSSPDGGEGGASGTSGVIGVDLENINAAEEQGLDINEKEGQDVSFYKYANGESVTTSQHNQQFSAENSSIIDLMEEGDSYSSVVKGFSSNTGDAEADEDNKGGSVSENRAKIMRSFGAEVIRVKGNYDNSLKECIKQSNINKYVSSRLKLNQDRFSIVSKKDILDYENDPFFSNFYKMRDFPWLFATRKWRADRYFDKKFKGLSILLFLIYINLIIVLI